MQGSGRSSLLEVEDLVKHFAHESRLGARREGPVRAVDGVSFAVDAGQTLGLVGESGCGKSTTARAILRLIEPTSGKVRFDGTEITALGRPQLRELRRDMQMVFQDPYSSLDPRMSVGDVVEEPLKAHRVCSRSERREVVQDLLQRVGLEAGHAQRYPNEFSGGQRQRVALARALALRPRLVICDEPVSKLDVSVQAQIINLLEDLQDELHLTYVFIAHDLAVVRHISHRVAVMYLGRIVELAPKEDLFDAPLHPYTRSLLSAIPLVDPGRGTDRERIVLRRDPPNPSDPPTGCRFHPRCTHAQAIARGGMEESVRIGAGVVVPRRCVEEAPVLEDKRRNHRVACHFC